MVQDRDLGYRRVIASLADLSGAGVLVGIPEREGAELTPEGATVAEYATYNEYGTANGHVPERSFLRSTVDEKRRQYVGAFAKAIGRVLDGRSAVRHELGLIGARAAGDVRHKIRTLREPPNAASTIRQKGSANPLIDTGTLRQAITHVLEEDR